MAEQTYHSKRGSFPEDFRNFVTGLEKLKIVQLFYKELYIATVTVIMNFYDKIDILIQDPERRKKKSILGARIEY